MLLLLVTWWCMEPGHQQILYLSTSSRVFWHQPRRVKKHGSSLLGLKALIKANGPPPLGPAVLYSFVSLASLVNLVVTKLMLYLQNSNFYFMQIHAVEKHTKKQIGTQTLKEYNHYKKLELKIQSMHYLMVKISQLLSAHSVRKWLVWWFSALMNILL